MEQKVKKKNGQERLRVAKIMNEAHLRHKANIKDIQRKKRKQENILCGDVIRI